jgi:alanine dehydrogenase
MGLFMIVGCPKEIKTLENRVGLIPATVKTLVASGAKVIVEKGAGTGSNISDQAYVDAGAHLVERAQDIWAQADIIAKVKEPLPEEFPLFRENQVLYTFLHLAAEPELAEALLKKKVTAIGYETIEVNGQLPLLKPMSEVAGRMAVQVGAWCLENQHGGKGILLGGVPGVKKGRVLILGAGVVGKNAAKMALGLGARVTMMDVSASRLEEIDDLFLGQVETVYSSAHAIENHIARSDLVIGAVLLTGARAPRLVTKEMIKTMEKGSVIIDVSVDQGGCVETMRRTMHDAPTYVVDGIVHYGVANMPGAVASTSTFALAHATSHYLIKMVQEGVFVALKNNEALRKGLNTHNGHVTHPEVAGALGKKFQLAEQLI